MCPEDGCIQSAQRIAQMSLLVCALRHMISPQHGHFRNTHGKRYIFNTLRPRQDERHFADDIFMCIFFNGNCCILIKFSLNYVRKGPIDNNPALVEIMAWRRSGDKPLSEPMMISLPTQICVTRPQWVKDIHFQILLIYLNTVARFAIVIAAKGNTWSDKLNFHSDENESQSTCWYVDTNNFMRSSCSKH